MVAQPQPRTDTLTEEERAFLNAFPDDRERSPWMVSTDFQEMAIAALRYALQRYRADWYVSSDLPILYPKPNNKVGQVAPDIMVAFVHNHPREAFDVRVEGGFPPFVLEVVSTESRSRDTEKDRKVRAYDLLGAREYAIFDPRAKRRPPLTGYRRAADGRWEAWPLDERGALRSAVLGLTLVQGGMLLRLEDVHGHRLPIAEEEAATALAVSAELLAVKGELARERGAREVAERALAVAQDETAALRAEVARLREGRRG